MTRYRKVNYKQIVQNTVDQYPNDWQHGLQKDAIQNSWDAKVSEEGKGWKVMFDIISVKDKTFFTIQDFGTHGLTGNETAEDYETKDIELIPERERWAKFECYGATKENVNTLGSRGQGKFLFIHASESARIFYESIREDDTYRFGFTEKYGEIIDSWEDEEARDRIRSRLGIDSIMNQGTRIIIEDPKQELLSYYEKDFLEAIEETWWPLLRKFNVEIILRKEGKQHAYAEIPSIFVNSSSLKNKGLQDISFDYGSKSNRERGGIKRLYIACSNSELPERFVGIAVFRNGMKVLNIPYQGSPDYNNKVFGYVEFEEKTDQLLKKIELSSHYGFKKNASLWGRAKDRIVAEINIFARDYLGIGKKEHIEEENAQRDRKVNSLINRLINQFDIPIDITLSGPTPTPSPPGPNPTPPEPKDICIYDSKVFYTDNDIKRITFGEELWCSCKIKGYDLRRLRIKIGIDSGTKIRYFENSLVYSMDVGVYKKITEASFEKGKYQVVFQLISVSDQNILDEKRHTLWIESYPPGKSAFKMKEMNFEDDKDMEWELNYGEKEIHLNANHPHRKYIRQQGEETIIKHNVEIGILAAIDLTLWRIEINEIERSAVEGNMLFENLLSNDNSKRINAALRVHGKIREILYGNKS